MSKIQINNEIRDMTAEEQAQFDADVVARQAEIEKVLSLTCFII